jgi:acyl-coenzyme A synthetase/AMP-(fatty) acid ligase
MYDYLLTHAGSLKGKLSSVRMFICAGEKLYADTFLGWQKAFGKKLVEHYGSSEMCHPIISNRPGNERANSFGRLLPGFQAKLNGQGMLLYRGPSLFCAYLGEEPLRRKKLAKGFFLSDDIACQDKAGYFYFQGRSNLVFKSDGKWVSAQDIESGLRRLSFVKEAAVLRGNRGLDYFVSLRSARLNRSEIEKKIRRYCLARFKPHEFGARINILDGLPHLASGKINRRKLEESFIKRS